MPDRRKIRATNGTNLGGANAHNRRVIIEALRLNGALSRADLARATQLTKQTVSNLVEDLESTGLIHPLDTVRAVRGKPATPYELSANGAYSFGLHIDRHVVRLVAANLLGDVLLQREVRSSDPEPERVMPAILDMIDRARSDLSSQFPEFRQRLIGLGVAMPGPFGVATEEDDPMSMSRWQRYPLLHEFTRFTGLEVTIQNDATAATAAERLTGAAHRLETAVCIYLGYGLGAGLLLDGVLFTGPNGNAGEIGMVLAPNDDGTEPSALERSASIASLCAALGLDPAAPELFERIQARLEQPDAAFMAWIDHAVRRLRWLIHMLETMFDPQTVIICGGAPPSLIAVLAERLEPLLPSLAARPHNGSPRITVGHADQWAVARGAAAEPMARFSEPRYSTMLKT